MRYNFRTILLGGTAAAICAVMPMAAQAQEAAAAPEAPETVVVSGTRISIAGYQAPTPVTVVGVAQLNRDAKTSIGDSLRELPSVGPSVSPNNGGNSNNASQGDAGIDTINLRNLGIQRTLILFDGQRVISSNLLGGGVDLSTIPSTLVQRVDVVTGGASAAYGSDAVSGVVNIIINKQFTGFKANIQGSDTTSFDHRQWKVEGAWGTDFAGGKGHFILSGNYTMSPDTVFQGQAKWWNNTILAPNPAATSTNGQPLYIHVNHFGNTQYTPGGLIISNSANPATGGQASTTALRGTTVGTQFTGTGGTPTPFNFGTTFSNFCYNGCSASEANGTGRYAFLSVPYHNSNIFGYTSYQVTPTIKASLQLNYGLNSEQNTGSLRLSQNRINADNPYLDPTIAARLGAITYPNGAQQAPAQFLTVGTQNINNSGPSGLTMHELCSSVGQPCNVNNRALMRGVFNLDGTIGDDWTWSAYIQHSGIRERQHVYNNTITARYNYAIDAVRVTPANVGASGLPIGSIQCRSLLSGVTPGALPPYTSNAGCVPLNVLGTGVVTQAALNYVDPGRDPSSGIVDDETIIGNQDVFAGSMQGTLPWELPAGKVAVAFGAEHRHEQAGVTQANPVGAISGWAAGNFVAYKGQYTVDEGFLEVDAPLLKDNIVQTLNLNAAGRITGYSTSGLVQTWKLGLTSQVNDDIRLRTSWSLDIRAPLISELFAPGTPASQTCVYPIGAVANQCFQYQGGNINLKPEKAVTVSGGIVLTPHWVPGLTLSADWYSINLHGEIFSTNYQTVLNRCALGETIYCGQITLNAAGQATQVNVFPLNAASDSVSGLDFQANYAHDLFGGTMDWMVVGNYNDQQSRTALGVTYDSAGAVGGSPDSYAAAYPKFRATLGATYNEGPFSATVQGRLIGSARLSNGTEGQPGISQASINAAGVITGGTIAGVVDNNSIPFVAYLDLRGSYKWSDNFQFYGAIDNVTNVPPPTIATTTGGNNGGTNPLIYDALGRTIRAGVRITY